MGSRKVRQRLRKKRVFRAETLLANRQRAFMELKRVGGIASLELEQPKVRESPGEVGVIRSERFFAKARRLPITGLGLLEVALAMIQPCEMIEACGNFPASCQRSFAKHGESLFEPLASASQVSGFIERQPKVERHLRGVRAPRIAVLANDGQRLLECVHRVLDFTERLQDQRKDVERLPQARGVASRSHELDGSFNPPTRLDEIPEAPVDAGEVDQGRIEISAARKLLADFDGAIEKVTRTKEIPLAQDGAGEIVQALRHLRIVRLQAGFADLESARKATGRLERVVGRQERRSKSRQARGLHESIRGSQIGLDLYGLRL